MATPCIACARPARLAICLDCATKAEAVVHQPVAWTEFEQMGVHAEILKEGFSECYKNSRYTVLWRNVESRMGELVHLSIKRNDRLPIHDWRDLQRIKNEILGPEHEAMELYPAESRVVDTANQYHLWCFLGERAPFGYEAQRCVMEETGETGAKQRPFEEKPDDLLTEEQFQARLAEHNRLRIAKSALLDQIRSIIEKAASVGGCQNPSRYTDERTCETVHPSNTEYWCGPCMARLLKKLGSEVQEITKEEGGRRG
jgi:hypothetical protein